MQAERKSCAGSAPSSARSNSTRNGALKICSKLVFSCGLSPKADQTAQAHVFRRAGEGFDVRRVNGRLPDFFDVRRMPQAGQRVTVK